MCFGHCSIDFKGIQVCSIDIKGMQVRAAGKSSKSGLQHQIKKSTTTSGQATRSGHTGGTRSRALRPGTGRQTSRCMQYGSNGNGEERSNTPRSHALEMAGTCRRSRIPAFFLVLVYMRYYGPTAQGAHTDCCCHGGGACRKRYQQRAHRPPRALPRSPHGIIRRDTKQQQLHSAAF